MALFPHLFPKPVAVLSIRLRFDASQATRLLAELGDAPSEIRDAFLGALEAGEQLFLLECDDRLACRTGEMIVRLQPTDRLIRLFAALGAGDRNGGVVEHPECPFDGVSSGAVGQHRSAPFPASPGFDQDPGAAGHLRDTSLETGAEPSKQLRPFSRKLDLGDGSDA